MIKGNRNVYRYLLAHGIVVYSLAIIFSVVGFFASRTYDVVIFDIILATTIIVAILALFVLLVLSFSVFLHDAKTLLKYGLFLSFHSFYIGLIWYFFVETRGFTDEKYFFPSLILVLFIGLIFIVGRIMVKQRSVEIGPHKAVIVTRMKNFFAVVVTIFNLYIVSGFCTVFTFLFWIEPYQISDLASPVFTFALMTSILLILYVVVKKNILLVPLLFGQLVLTLFYFFQYRSTKVYWEFKTFLQLDIVFNVLFILLILFAIISTYIVYRTKIHCDEKHFFLIAYISYVMILFSSLAIINRRFLVIVFPFQDNEMLLVNYLMIPIFLFVFSVSLFAPVMKNLLKL